MFTSSKTPGLFCYFWWEESLELEDIFVYRMILSTTADNFIWFLSNLFLDYSIRFGISQGLFLFFM